MSRAKPQQQTDQAGSATPEKSLSSSVHKAMQDYFNDLDGHEAGDLYELFMQQVEKPFFDVVMQHTRGNITHAAKMLGMNRVTLRNRLKKYELD